MKIRDVPIDSGLAVEYNTPEREVTAVKTRRWLWILGIAIGAVTLLIWSMSLQVGEVSTQQSDAIAEPLAEQVTTPGNWLNFFSILVRKSAHFLEFALLGLLWGGFSRLKKCPAPWLYGLPVALIDETIQHFVPGRAPAIGDVVLDYLGYLFGFLLMVLTIFLIRKKCKN